MYLLPLKVPHRKIEFWIVFMFIYLFIHSLIHIFFYYYLFVSLNLIYINQVWHFCFEISSIIAQHVFTSTQSASLYFFLDLIWFILNTGMTFLFWNHSIIGQHVFTSTQSASPQDWVLNCIYVYLFIHSFTYSYFFFTIHLFVSLNWIYINQVWHFCLKSFNNRPAFIYFHSKCLTARLSFELYLCLFIYSFIHLFIFFFLLLFICFT